MTNEVIQWFIDNGIEQTSSPSDTPEMNSVAERAHAFLYPTALALLLHGDMPKSFWEYAYLAASMIKGYVIYDTCNGHVTSDEAWYGKVPNVKHLRGWGAKAWIQEPRSAARKDWHPRAVAGRMIGYSKLPLGWIFWVPEIQDVVVSVNAKFDEDIPSRAKLFRAELEPELLPVDPVERSLSSYKYLIDCYFIDTDDACLYQVTRVKTLKDRSIVGYVRPILAGRRPREARQPIHIADLAKMVAESSSEPSVLERALDSAIDNTAAAGVTSSIGGLRTGVQDIHSTNNTEERSGAPDWAGSSGVDGLATDHAGARILQPIATPAHDMTVLGLITPGNSEPRVRGMPSQGTRVPSKMSSRRAINLPEPPVLKCLTKLTHNRRRLGHWRYP